MLKSKKKKKTPAITYHQTLETLEGLIGQVAQLQSAAHKNGDKIAMWTLAHMYEDLIKSYHRLGNIRLTIKGNQE